MQKVNTSSNVHLLKSYKKPIFGNN